MKKTPVCISYDHENDKNYRYILEAWDANPEFDFEFNNETPNEINSDSISRIKAGLTIKIKLADYLLVIVGKYANQKHKNSGLIGAKNWINWEIYKAKELRKQLVGVKLDKSNESPDELLGSGTQWAMSFTRDSIIEALHRA